VFDAISQYALERLAAFVGKRHKRSRRWGMRKVTCASPDNLGPITLCGIVFVPGFSVLEGNGRTPAVKNVAEPCAGEPHARFDGEGWKPSLRPPRQPLTLALGEAS